MALTCVMYVAFNHWHGTSPKPVECLPAKSGDGIELDEGTGLGSSLSAAFPNQVQVGSLNTCNSTQSCLKLGCDHAL